MRKKRSPVWKIPTKELKESVKNSSTYKDVLEHFQLLNKGGNKTLKRRLDYEGIDYSHITQYGAIRTLEKMLDSSYHWKKYW